MRPLLVGLTLTATLAASGESGWLEPSAPLPWCWLVVTVGLPLALGLLLRSKGPFQSVATRHGADLSVVAHALGYAAILYPLGWVRFCLDDLGWRTRPLPSIALLLVPAIVLAVSIAGALIIAGGRRPRAVASPVRLVAVFAGVFLLAVAAVDRLEGWDPAARILDLHPELSFVAGALIMAGLFVVAPLLTLLAIPTRPLPPSPLRDRLLEIARGRGLHLLDIRLWGAADDVSLNACAIGIVPGTKMILLSPSLIRILKPEEVTAVFAHEAAHLQRRHLWGYLLLVSALLLWIGAFATALRPLSSLLNAALLMVVVGLFLRYVLGPVSRRFELEADAYGADVVGHGEYAAVLLRMIVLLSTAARRDGWRHYSLKRRLDMILELTVDPSARERLARRLRRTRVAAGALLAAAVVTFALGGVLDVATERVDGLLSASEASLSVAESLRRVLEERRPPEPLGLQRPVSAVEAQLQRMLDRSRVYLEEARILVGDDDLERVRHIDELSERALRARDRVDPAKGAPPVTP